MKCGSTRPTVMRRSAATKRRSINIGIPEGVRPRSTWACRSRPKWFSMRTVLNTASEPMTSRSSSPVVGPVQAGGHKDQDVLLGDAPGHELRNERRQQQAVGNGAGDVADQDAGRLARAGELPQRGGGRGGLKGLFQVAGRVRRRRHGAFADGRDLQMIRKINGQLAAAVQEVDLHRCTSFSMAYHLPF